MKRKIITILSIIILIFIAVICCLKCINKTYNVKVVGYYVSKYKVDDYYPIVQEVILEFKTKEKTSIIDELKKQNINNYDFKKIYIWNDSAKEAIVKENYKRKNNDRSNYLFENEFEEISLNTIINKDLNLLIEIK